MILENCIGPAWVTYSVCSQGEIDHGGTFGPIVEDNGCASDADLTVCSLDRSGWLVFEYDVGKTADVDQLRDWVMERYCAVAPKKLVDLVTE